MVVAPCPARSACSACARRRRWWSPRSARGPARPPYCLVSTRASTRAKIFSSRADRGVGGQGVHRAVGAAEHQPAVGAPGDRGEVGAVPDRRRRSRSTAPRRDVDREVPALGRPGTTVAVGRRRSSRWPAPAAPRCAARPSPANTVTVDVPARAAAEHHQRRRRGVEHGGRRRARPAGARRRRRRRGDRRRDARPQRERSSAAARRPGSTSTPTAAHASTEAPAPLRARRLAGLRAAATGNFRLIGGNRRTAVECSRARTARSRAVTATVWCGHEPRARTATWPATSLLSRTSRPVCTPAGSARSATAAVSRSTSNGSTLVVEIYRPRLARTGPAGARTSSPWPPAA